MKNAWANYLFIRIGLFVGILVIFLLLNVDQFVSAILAAVLSLAISLLFFSRQRNAVSEAVYRAIEKRKNQGEADTDSDHENALLDQAASSAEDVNDK
ncbi:MAG: hypothetical protein RL196_713 [Actinomycetota bacterium]|jgi:uncharacterized protein YacL